MEYNDLVSFAESLRAKKRYFLAKLVVKEALSIAARLKMQEASRSCQMLVSELDSLSNKSTKKMWGERLRR